MEIRKKLISFLRRFKNLDIRLREYPLYEYCSFYSFNAMRHLLRLKPIGHHKIIEHHYIKQFKKLDVKRKTVLFDSFQGQKIAGDPYAIYRALREKNDDYSITWVAQTGTYVPKDVREDHLVNIVKYASKAHAVALASCETLVINMNLPYFFIKRKDQVIINTWHGVPMKKLGLDINQPLRLSANTQRCFNISDIISVASKYEYEKTLGACGAGIDDYILTLGSPRVDLMLGADRENIRRQLGVSQHTKLVLYAPTWRGGAASVSSQISDQISAIMELQLGLGAEYEVIVSLHHFTKAALKDRSINVKELPVNIDTNEALQAVDILVSDYSSIALDFLILNKPLVLFTPDYQQYSTERGLYFEIKELPAKIAFNSADLVHLVKQGVKPSEYDEYDSKLRHFFSSEDGEASKRIVNLINSIHESPKKPKKPKNSRKNILIYPGALKNNGITSSLKFLVESLTSSEFRITLLIDTRLQNKIPEFHGNFCFFKDKVDFILVDRSFPKHGETAIVYKKYLSDPDSLEAREEEILDVAFQQEVSRLLGNCHFFAAIDFSGYDQYWTHFISSVNSRKKIVFLHSDMRAEYENPRRRNGRLRHVFTHYKRFDVVASVSDALRVVNEEGLSSYFNKNKSTTITNTIGVKRIRENSNVPLGIILPEMALLSKNTTKFILVGRLSPEKNIKLAIDSFNEVAGNHECVLFIVGAGPLLKELTSYAATKEHGCRIKFVGNLPNPYPAIKAADCLLLTSHYEGQPLVLLEALTLGKFCIASDIPAAKSVLKGTGCTIAKADINSFSKAMSEFIIAHPTVRFDADRYNNLALTKLKDTINM